MFVRGKKRGGKEDSCLEHVAEVQVFKVGHVQESLLDLDLGHRARLRVGNLEVSVLAILLLLFLGRGGGSTCITDLVAAVEVPAENEDDDNLGAVRDLYKAKGSGGVS
jgi:hypothetical protein